MVVLSLKKTKLNLVMVEKEELGEKEVQEEREELVEKEVQEHKVPCVY